MNYDYPKCLSCLSVCTCVYAMKEDRRTILIYAYDESEEEEGAEEGETTR